MPFLRKSANISLKRKLYSNMSLSHKLLKLSSMYSPLISTLQFTITYDPSITSHDPLTSYDPMKNLLKS